MGLQVEEFLRPTPEMRLHHARRPVSVLRHVQERAVPGPAQQDAHIGILLQCAALVQLTEPWDLPRGVGLAVELTYGHHGNVQLPGQRFDAARNLGDLGLTVFRTAKPSTPIATIRAAATGLAKDTLDAIRHTRPEDPEDRWLPPQVEPIERPTHVTASKAASYTNYRYWPELLSSGLLPVGMANRLVEARLSFGGQFCGMTRFRDWLDDWPLADYLYGLWSLGRENDFLLSLYGHIAYHQAEGHLAAYEQVTFPPGRPRACYCLPSQLVAARAARLLVPGT